MIDWPTEAKTGILKLQLGPQVGGHLAPATCIQVTQVNSGNGYDIDSSTINIVLIIVIIIMHKPPTFSG